MYDNALHTIVASLLCLAAVAAAALTPAKAETPAYTEQGFMDAALDNCTKVENRKPASCDCEQKLIKDRLGPDDKVMAYYYWVDKKKFTEEYQSRTTADAKWPEAFSERFTTMQALIIAACGP